MSKSNTPLLFAGAMVAVLLLGRSPAPGCDTPVYRYAMYRWEAAPYEVYYFHKGAIAEEAARMHRLIDEAGTSEKQPANLMLAKVDLAKDAELKGVPRDVGKLWKEKQLPVPGYLVVSPHGAPLFSGTLDERQLRALIDSPARRELAQQLAEGKATVLILLAGKEASANAAAEKLVQELQQDIAAGKIELYSGPPEMDEERAKPKKPPAPTIGLVKVARDDAQERWLVESLIGLDAELQKEEFRGQPMLFSVFGRGRALPPFVGKEINRDNLLAAVDFVTGACSCTVKDQNPGVDLLMAQDWNSVAGQLAEKFGAEEGTAGQFGPEAMFPRLVVPGDDAEPKTSVALAPTKPSSDPAAPDATESAVATKKSPATGDKPPADKQAAKATDQPKDKAADKAADKPQDKPQELPAEDPSQAAEEVAAAPPPAGGALGSVFVVGIGMAFALVALFALTFFVLRPR